MSAVLPCKIIEETSWETIIVSDRPSVFSVVGVEVSTCWIGTAAVDSASSSTPTPSGTSAPKEKKQNTKFC